MTKRSLLAVLPLLPALAFAHATDHAHSHAAIEALLEWLSEPAALASLVVLLPAAGVALRQLWLKHRRARAGRA